MIANIIKTQVFDNIKYDLRDHTRSHRALLCTLINLRFIRNPFCFNSNLIKLQGVHCDMK